VCVWLFGRADQQQKKVIRSRFVRVILAQGPC
jgi:hypothetical protein